jgi:glycine betaine transporter
MLSEGGTLNPSNKIKMTWGIIQSAVAAVLLLSGGLEVLANSIDCNRFSFCDCHALYVLLLTESTKQ